MNWNILQRWKIFHFWWKIFHFGEIFFLTSRPSRLPNCIPEGICGNFSTLVENFPLRKISKKKKFLFQNQMNWNILQRWKFFHFWWKIFHFGEILFSGSGPLRLPNLSPKMQSGKFSTLVENFPLSKSCKKKNFLFQNHMNWVILHRKVFSEKSENFPLFPKTRKFRKFISSGL